MRFSLCFSCLRPKKKDEPESEEVVSIVKLDGKVLEYKTSILVKDVLARYIGCGISLTQKISNCLPPDYELKLGHFYYLLPLHHLESDHSVKKIKVVISKQQLQLLLSKKATLEEVLLSSLQACAGGNRPSSCSWRLEVVISLLHLAMASTKEVNFAGVNLIINQLPNISDPVTGRPLTGAWLWDSAIHLARHTAEAVEAGLDLRGKTVLELGAGTGLPGLTAAMLGAARVVLTDVAAVLPCLNRNVEANGLVGLVDVRELAWGSSAAAAEVGSVDMVLMSDVFYDPSEMWGLAETLKAVCHPGTAPTELRASTWECMEALRREGFVVAEQPVHSVEDEEKTFSIFVLELPSKEL